MLKIIKKAGQMVAKELNTLASPDTPAEQVINTLVAGIATLGLVSWYEGATYSTLLSAGMILTSTYIMGQRSGVIPEIKNNVKNTINNTTDLVKNLPSSATDLANGAKNYATNMYSSMFNQPNVSSVPKANESPKLNKVDVEMPEDERKTLRTRKTRTLS